MPKATKALTTIRARMLACVTVFSAVAAAPALAQDYPLVAVPVSEVAADLPSYPASISQQFANPPIVQAMSSLSVCNAEFTAQKARAASLQTAYNAADGTTETIAGTVLGGCFDMAPTTIVAGALLTITQNSGNQYDPSFALTLPASTATVCSTTKAAILTSLKGPAASPFWYPTPIAGMTQNAACN